MMNINLGCPVFKIFICHIHCVCIGVHVCGSLFLPSTMWVLGTKLRPPGKVASAFAH